MATLVLNGTPFTWELVYAHECNVHVTLSDERGVQWFVELGDRGDEPSHRMCDHVHSFTAYSPLPPEPSISGFLRLYEGVVSVVDDHSLDLACWRGVGGCAECVMDDRRLFDEERDAFVRLIVPLLPGVQSVEAFDGAVVQCADAAKRRSVGP